MSFTTLKCTQRSNSDAGSRWVRMAVEAMKLVHKGKERYVKDCRSLALSLPLLTLLQAPLERKGHGKQLCCLARDEYELDRGSAEGISGCPAALCRCFNVALVTLSACILFFHISLITPRESTGPSYQARGFERWQVGLLIACKCSEYSYPTLRSLDHQLLRRTRLPPLSSPYSEPRDCVMRRI